MNQELFSDHFSSSAQQYARFRPRYPAALFEWLAALCPRRALAWDCATGNGQAAVELARSFDRVIATDASENQIANAQPDPQVTYRVALAEDSGLDDSAADLVTVAQALHWFDHRRFFAEVARVLAPGGVIAVWSYQLASVDAAVDRVIHHLYGDVVGACWPPERALVEQGYAEIALPFPEMAAPQFAMEEMWNLPRWIGYLTTWSAVAGYRKKFGSDPIELVRPELERAWGDPAAPRSICWPLQLRVARKEAPAERPPTL